MQYGDLPKIMLEGSICKDIKYLFKSQLEILDLLSKEYQMSDESKQNFRKLILDRGNEVIRGVQNELDKYQIEFKL